MKEIYYKIRSLLPTSYFLLLTACFLLLSPMGVFAGQPSSGVSAIQSTYQKIQDLQSDFTQSTYVEVLGSTIKDRGVFSMKKPGLMRIEYTGEHPKTYISNGKKLWIIDPELDQVETHTVSGETVPREALEFLKGFGNMRALFKVEPWESEHKEEGHVYLKLTPKSASAHYKWLACDFGPDNILKMMTISNKSGNLSTYIFTGIKINQGLDKGLFIYK